MRLVFCLMMSFSVLQVHAAPLYKCVYFKVLADGTVDRGSMQSGALEPRSEDPYVELGEIDEFLAVAYTLHPMENLVGIDICKGNFCHYNTDEKRKIGEFFDLTYDDPSGVKYRVECDPGAKN